MTRRDEETSTEVTCFVRGVRLIFHFLVVNVDDHHICNRSRAVIYYSRQFLRIFAIFEPYLKVDSIQITTYKKFTHQHFLFLPGRSI